MIIKINMQSEVPIYLQLRNEIVKGIGRGEFEPGESLPTVRQMATDLGINTMTVSKAYQLLKTEGFLETDRRKGTTICYPLPLLHKITALTKSWQMNWNF